MIKHFTYYVTCLRQLVLRPRRVRVCLDCGYAWDNTANHVCPMCRSTRTTLTDSEL